MDLDDLEELPREEWPHETLAAFLEDSAAAKKKRLTLTKAAVPSPQAASVAESSDSDVKKVQAWQLEWEMARKQEKYGVKVQQFLRLRDRFLEAWYFRDTGKFKGMLQEFKKLGSPNSCCRTRASVGW